MDGADSAPTTSTVWTGVSGVSGLAIAVGHASFTLKIMTSANDGTSWTARTPGLSINEINGVVTVSGGTHVAVGFDTGTNTITTSTDGTTWTQRTGGWDHSYYDTACKMELIYVAVGMDNGANLRRALPVTRLARHGRREQRSGECRCKSPPIYCRWRRCRAAALLLLAGTAMSGIDPTPCIRRTAPHWVARNAANSLVGPVFSGRRKTIGNRTMGMTEEAARCRHRRRCHEGHADAAGRAASSMRRFLASSFILWGKPLPIPPSATNAAQS